MSEEDTKKETEEKKLKRQKARGWAAVAYMDSVKDDWVEVLQTMCIDGLISPLHDKDCNPDGEPKKPHWHIMLVWDGPTTYNNALETFESIGAVMDRRALQSISGYARYLTHMDNPEKAQYDPDEVIELGSADFFEMIKKSQITKSALKDIYEFIDVYRIAAYSQLVRAVYRLNKPDWIEAVDKKYTRPIIEYIKSNNWLINNPDKNHIADELKFFLNGEITPEELEQDFDNKLNERGK